VKNRQKFKERISNYFYDKISPVSGRFSYTVEGLLYVLNYKVFKETYDFLQKSQWWSEDQIKVYQLNQLSKLLEHAYKNVPYYQKIFDIHGLKPKSIKSFEDLQKIPFLTKEIVQEKLNDLKATNYPDYKFSYLTTGGSAGIPLGFYEEKSISYAKELAYYNISLSRVDCNIKDKTVILRGEIFPRGDKGKFWKRFIFNRILVLSSYHLTDKNLPIYINKIQKFKPKQIIAYPSSITLLARFMKKNNYDPFKTLKVIVCGAETLYDWQRNLLEGFFKCRVFESYGHAEQAVHAGACEKSNYFHFFPEYGIVELLDKNGNAVKKENELGEIVATGFKNYLFPFIRYRTGDLGVYTYKKCSCGRKYPMVKKIQGRIQEFIVTKNNRLISMTAINMHSEAFDNVKQFQFHQGKKGQVVLNVIKKSDYTEKDTEKIKLELGKKLGDDADLEIKFVDEIPRTDRGKHRFLVQKLSVNFGDNIT